MSHEDNRRQILVNILKEREKNFLKIDYLVYVLFWLILPFSFHDCDTNLGIYSFLLGIGDHQGMSHMWLPRSVKQKYSQTRGILTLIPLS